MPYCALLLGQGINPLDSFRITDDQEVFKPFAKDSVNVHIILEI